jgi:transposase
MTSASFAPKVRVGAELELRDLVDRYPGGRRLARFHVHFTPTYGSWLNLVERWFALLEQRQL